MDRYITLRCTKYDYLLFLQRIFAQETLPKAPNNALLLALLMGKNYLQRNIGVLAFPKPKKPHNINLAHADAVAAYLLLTQFGGNYEHLLARDIILSLVSYGITLQ